MNFRLSICLTILVLPIRGLPIYSNNGAHTVAGGYVVNVELPNYGRCWDKSAVYASSASGGSTWMTTRLNWGMLDRSSFSTFSVSVCASTIAVLGSTVQ